MFIDEVHLTLKAGDGGDGIVSWRREKYIPKWGPYGWDGGNGGDIILRATTHETTLGKFRHMKVIKGENGGKWGTQEMHGASAPDTIIEVPVGTIVTDIEDDSIICDLTKPGEEFIICEGGRGGFGNAHFPSSTRQAPNFAELWDKGDVLDVKMELKLVADIWLVGLPNAGKSTLIQSVTNVRPKIANYAFTTLTPNLWVMEWKGRSLVIEDVPGLIEWASEGKWLGFQFLKHIERCGIIIHLIDATVWEDTMIENYKIIRTELEKWSDILREKQELIVFSKVDLIDPDMLDEMKEIFEKKTGKKVAQTLSAGAYIRIDEFRDLLILALPEKEQEEIEEITERKSIYDLKKKTDPKRCTITKRDDGDYEVSGERIEEIARMTDTRYVDGVNRVYDVLEKLGVMRKLKLLITEEWSKGNSGFFEWEDDIEMPSVWVGWKKFSLEWLIFMKEGSLN
jgi:GTPase